MVISVVHVQFQYQVSLLELFISTVNYTDSLGLITTDIYCVRISCLYQQQVLNGNSALAIGGRKLFG